MGLLPMDASILPPSDDRVFKLIMTAPDAKPALMQLISGILNREVVDVTLHNNELPPGDTMEKAERFDVNCKIEDGTQFNLEMQASQIREDADGQYRNLKGKSLYYLCDLHSSQPSKGTLRYDRLSRTYQVTFCSYTIFPNRVEYLNSFSMRHDMDNELLLDAIHVVFVELSKLEKLLQKPVKDMTVLDKWALFLRYAPDPEQRETLNQVLESEEVLQMAGNLLMNISQNEKERARYRSRRKFLTDYQSDMATSWDNGKAEGFSQGVAQGITEGMEKGMRNTTVAIAQKMLNRGRPIDEIMEDTGLSREEVERLQK